MNNNGALLFLPSLLTLQIKAPSTLKCITINAKQKSTAFSTVPLVLIGSGGWLRAHDLRVMYPINIIRRHPTSSRIVAV